MDYQALYREKLRTADEAVKIVRDGDWVDYSQTCSYPQALDAALARRSGEVHDVKIRCAISMIPIHTIEQDPHGSFTYNLWHCSGLDGSISIRAVPGTCRCCSATTEPITEKAMHRSMSP